MSKYTLELRRIHETYKVFNFDYDFYVNSEAIKTKFEEKFIDEYYFNEIGFETVARFQHRLKTKLNKWKNDELSFLTIFEETLNRYGFLFGDK